MSETKRAIFNLDEDLYPMTITGINKTGGELENGGFVEVGGLIDNGLGRETYELKKITDDGVRLGFVSDPCLMYDERETERDFVCAQDQLIRTYLPNKSTVGTFAEKHFENGSTLKKGDKLIVKKSSNQLTKYVDSGNVVAEVLEKVDFEGQSSIVVAFH